MHKLLETHDDIWEWHVQGHYIVIPTNLGYKSNGHNVMGRGLAQDAAYRYPDIPKIYGEYCRSRTTGSGVMLIHEHRLVLFPTKPLDKKNPQLSWRQSSSLDTIESALMEINSTVDMIEDPHCQVVFPLVGCGNGNLDPEDVLPLLRRYLNGGRFVLCFPPDHA